MAGVGRNLLAADQIKKKKILLATVILFVLLFYYFALNFKPLEFLV